MRKLSSKLTIRHLSKITRIAPSQIADLVGLRGIDAEVEDIPAGITDAVLGALSVGNDVLLNATDAQALLGVGELPPSLLPYIDVGGCPFYSEAQVIRHRRRLRGRHRDAHRVYQESITPPVEEPAS